MSQITNNLSIPIEVFVIIDQKPKRKACMNEGKRESRIEAGKTLEYSPFEQDDSITKSFMILFEMGQVPEKDGIRGVKLALAGTRIPGPLSILKGGKIPHHFACYEQNSKYYAEIHYELGLVKNKLNEGLKVIETNSEIDVNGELKKILSDVDPNIKHPPGGGDGG